MRFFWKTSEGSCYRTSFTEHLVCLKCSKTWKYMRRISSVTFTFYSWNALDNGGPGQVSFAFDVKCSWKSYFFGVKIGGRLARLLRAGWACNC